MTKSKKSEWPENVRLVLEDAIQPHRLYANKPMEWFVGRLVKKAFPAVSGGEFMWVKVTHVEGEDLVGTLDNEPLMVEDIAYGDVVKLRKHQVLAVD